MNIESLEDPLREAVGATTAGDFSPALDGIKDLSRPDRLSDLISEVLRNSEEATRCAPYSFAHTLGFDKFALLDRKPEFMVRLHVWHPGKSSSPGHIHNHRSALVSAIIRGELGKQVFVRDPEEPPLAEYREELTRDGWRLRRIGTTGLRQIEVARLGVGTQYALMADTLHRVVVAEHELTATLFLEMKAVRGTTSVFTTVDEKVRTNVSKLPLALPEYRRRLRAVASALGL